MLLKGYAGNNYFGKIISTFLVLATMIFAMATTIGSYITIEPVFAVSNVSKFHWEYFKTGVDGRSQQVFHSLGKGTAQLNVKRCNNYTSGNKAKVILRKSSSKYPFYENCGSLSFYKKGVYSFGKVSKGSYWLHVTGGKSDCFKTAGGEVRNK